jgi:hypothetical protein
MKGTKRRVFAPSLLWTFEQGGGGLELIKAKYNRHLNGVQHARHYAMAALSELDMSRGLVIMVHLVW